MANNGDDSDIHFLADECVFVRTIKIVRKLGNTVRELSEFDLQGAKDPVVFQKAQNLNAVLLLRLILFLEISVFGVNILYLSSARFRC